MEPIVNGLEKELGDALIIIRADIQTDVGREVADEYATRMTPTFILLDGDGGEIWRSVGTLDADKVKQLIKSK